MYFKNKKTGIVWHVTDKDHQKRLLADTDYIVVKKENNEQKQKTVDFKNMDWQKLRKLAVENGINVHGKKRKQIEKELTEKVGGDSEK